MCRVRGVNPRSGAEAPRPSGDRRDGVSVPSISTFRLLRSSLSVTAGTLEEAGRQKSNNVLIMEKEKLDAVEERGIDSRSVWGFQVVCYAHAVYLDNRSEFINYKYRISSTICYFSLFHNFNYFSIILQSDAKIWIYRYRQIDQTGT